MICTKGSDAFKVVGLKCCPGSYADKSVSVHNTKSNKTV